MRPLIDSGDWLEALSLYLKYENKPPIPAKAPKKAERTTAPNNEA